MEKEQEMKNQTGIQNLIDFRPHSKYRSRGNKKRNYNANNIGEEDEEEEDYDENNDGE